jgi:hypothetical protein
MEGFPDKLSDQVIDCLETLRHKKRESEKEMSSAISFPSPPILF